jgi:phosphoglycolate phosphatase
MENPRYQLTVFDVDGTLHDSFLSIARSFQYALRHCGAKPLTDLASARRCIGPPIADCFRMLGVERDADIPNYIRAYRDFFDREGHLLVTLYDGVFDMLQALRKAGVGLAVATSKYREVIEPLLLRDGLLDLFGYVAANPAGGAAQSKESMIRSALCHFGVPRERAVMVGDRFYDAQGARDAGVDFIVAAYGMGEPEEFEGYPCVLTAQRAADIARFILGKQ